MTRRATVLVVGPDGSGKSAVVEALGERLRRDGHAVHTAHFRPGLIARSRSGGAVSEPHSQPPRAWPTAMLKLGATFLDVVVGWMGPWRRARRVGVLLVERGWFDQAVDPRRYRLPAELAGVVVRLGRLLPRADLAVLLGGSPSGIVSRKPELSETEVERQIGLWRQLLPLAGRETLELDTTTTSLDESVSAIDRALDDSVPDLRRVPLTARRLELSATHGADGAAAVAVYRPMRARARASLGIGLRLRTCAPRARDEARAATRAALHTYGGRVDGLAAMRSSGRGRWVIGLAADERLRAVAKVGRSTDEGLQREAAALQRLTSGPVLVPRVHGADAVDDRFVVVTEAEEVLDAQPHLSIDEVVGLCEAVASTGLTHGDLAPWNVLRTTRGLVVLDWEHSSDGADPVADLAHFLCQDGALLGRWTPQEVAEVLAASRIDRSSGLQTRLMIDRLRPNTDEGVRRFRQEVAACLD